jgi:serine protease DegQ
MFQFGKVIVVLALASAFSRDVTAQQMVMMPPPERSKAVPSLAPMLERVLPGVVSILVTGDRIRPTLIGGGTAEAAEPVADPFRAGGSGVIVDAERGIILTNHHVIVDAKRIDISLSDGRTATAQLIGSDIATDVAVIRTELRDLVAVPYGDSDRLRVGDFICAVGSPFGLDGSASQGIISALMRTDIGYGIFEEFLQVDAAVNPGNSGGALVDLEGRLVGINTATGSAKLRTQGISFAIPISLARAVARELERTGTFRRGALGFITENIGYEMARAMNLSLTRGAAITAVLPGSPAAAVGIKKGEVIVAIDGKPIRSHGDYVSRIATTPIAQKLTVSLVGAEGRRDVSMAVADIIVPATPVAAPAALTALSGLTLGALLPGFKIFGIVQGARVLAAEGAAARTGLKADDVVTKVDMASVRNPTDVYDAASSKMGRFRLEIHREGRTYWIWVEA